MITIDEIELRIATLKKALLNIPVDDQKYWNIKKEMDEYVVLRRRAIELSLSEISNPVSTNYYNQIITLYEKQ
ncbi:hypothetical protein [Empedobacter brevis]|uniref:hypothetical protein n=1 Tax=Empedobacter brevis TaxID=247 RepID=UPI0028D61C71|nr:hypothetical protein [Empedobacter brevis]